jgi:hypothetical protein
VTARLEIAGDHEVLTIAIERDVLAQEDLGKMLGRLRSEALVVFGRVDAFEPELRR